MTAEEAMERASDDEKPILELLISYSPIMSNRLKLDAARGIIKLRTSTPTNEVAQRARASLAANDIYQCFVSVTPDSGWTGQQVRDKIVAIIMSRLTATDVERTCTWTCEPNPDIEMWQTDCGNAFQFEVGGPTENKMQFCCYCGKWLVERVAEEREEGEGDG